MYKQGVQIIFSTILLFYSSITFAQSFSSPITLSLPTDHTFAAPPIQETNSQDPLYSVQQPNVSLWTLDQPTIDFALRIDAINRAEKSIDVVTYRNTVDPEIGAPMIEALRHAIYRGVKVRLLYEWLVTTHENPNDADEAQRRFLATPSLDGLPHGEVIATSFIKRTAKIKDPTDAFHEKILLIDVGQPNEMVWVGGRNNDNFALHDLDIALVMRRTKSDGVSLIDTLARVFDSIWKEASSYQTPKIQKSNQLNPIPKKPAPNYLLSLAPPGGLAQYLKLKWTLFKNLKRRSFWIPSLSPDEAVALRNPLFKDTFNNIDSALFKSIQNAKHRIRLSVMFTFMPPELLVLMKEAIHRGVKVEIYTNGIVTSYERIDNSFAYYLSSVQLLELKKAGEAYQREHHLSRANCTIYTLSPGKINQDPYFNQVKFLHQKLLVADNESFTGSDNFNISSRTKNSEILIHFSGNELASHFNRHFDRIQPLFIEKNSTELEEAKQNYDSLNWWDKTHLYFIKKWM